MTVTPDRTSAPCHDHDFTSYSAARTCRQRPLSPGADPRAWPRRAFSAARHARCPRAAEAHAGEPVVELGLCPRRNRFRRNDRHRQGPPRRTCRVVFARPPRDRDRAGLGRRHAQMAAPPRRRQGGRDRLHPRGGSRHVVHFEPSRLHAHLLLLSYRNAASRAQSDGRRDRRPDRACARPARRLAWGDGAGPARAARCDAQDHQCRAHGHGRAALQFRQCARRLPRRRRRRRSLHLKAPDHALNLGRGPGDPALGRGSRNDAGNLPACGARRAARQARADQQEMAASRLARKLPPLSRPLQRETDHLRICDAQRRQRFGRRGQGAGAAARQDPREDQPDPVQSLARRAVRMLGLGADREIRRGGEQGGLCEPGAEPARPRHHGGMRATQERKRQDQRASERLASPA